MNPSDKQGSSTAIEIRNISSSYFYQPQQSALLGLNSASAGSVATTGETAKPTKKTKSRRKKPQTALDVFLSGGASLLVRDK